MKNRISFFACATFLFLISTSIVNGQVDTLWTKTYGGASYEYCTQIQQTTDGGYIIVGYTNSFGAGLRDLWLIKTDPDGDTLWTKTYGGSHFDEGWSVLQTKDGGYIVAGRTYGEVWLIKTDSLGEAIWTKTLGGGWAKSIDQTSDGGYIIVGDKSISPDPPYPRDILLIKTDSSGDTIWTKTFRGDYAINSGISVKQITEDEYVFLGDSYVIGTDRCLLIKTDELGNTIWTKKYDLGMVEDSPYSFQQTIDGGYIIAGCTNSFSANYDVWILKTNASGDSLWTKVIGEIDDDEFAYSIQQTVAEDYIIAGLKELSGSNNRDVLLIKTDASGGTIWTTTFGGELSDYGNSVQLTKDGGYIIAGNTNSFGAGESDFWLIKTTVDINDVEENNGQTITDFKMLQNFPNPFNPTTTIKYQIPELSFATLKVYDLLGNEVAILVNEEKPRGNYEAEFNARELSSGVYFYKLKAGSFVETKKMVLVK